MRFEIFAKELLEGLKAINTKETFNQNEILNCIKIEIEKQDELITLYRNVLTSEYEITIQNNYITESGICVVNQKKLMEVLKNFGNQEIELYTENSLLTIKSKTLIIQLKTFEVGAYPNKINETFQDDTITVLQKDLKQVISKIKFAVSTDENRPMLNGIHINASCKCIDFVAIDGFRLALKYLENKDSANIKLNIPTTVITSIEGLLEASAGIIQIKKSNKYVKFTFGKKNMEVVIIARITEGDYMDYKTVVNITEKTKIEINAKDLKSAFLSIFQKTKNGETNIFTITTKENKMAMKTRTINGTADTEIETEIIGEGFDQDFNPRYFAEMVNVLDDEKLIIKNGGGYQATTISNEDGTTLYLVLPLRR